MTLQFAAKAYASTDFRTRATLAVSAVAASKITGTDPLTPGDRAMAKALLSNSAGYMEQITVVMLQVPSMHATDPAVTMPTDAAFQAAATTVWPYLTGIWTT